MGVRGALTAAQRADLERIRLNQRRLLGLINDVLNYAKVDAGRVEYDIRPTPVRDALAATEPVIQPLAAAKRIALEVEACDAALVAAADPDKLEQVLVNLLSNAVKFTEPGGRVAVSCTSDAHALRIAVRDTGVGIPADRLESIFDPFVQVDTRLTRTAGGTGLGLAISRDLARGMGGMLTAESEVGVGSVFTLVLPRA
jgi:signal transduction histidine kinase